MDLAGDDSAGVEVTPLLVHGRPLVLQLLKGMGSTWEATQTETMLKLSLTKSVMPGIRSYFWFKNVTSNQTTYVGP